MSGTERTFLLVSIGTEIPEGYRLATVGDVTENSQKARAAIAKEQWGMATLEDGKFDGPGYGYNVESGSFSNFGHKLIVTAQNFRNIPCKEHIPVGWHLATVNDVKKFTKEARDAVTKEWGISTLADGRIHGSGYNYKIDGSSADCAEKMIIEDETTWCIVQSNHSGLVLDIEGGNLGGRVITYPRHGGDNQLWKWKGNALVSKIGYALDVKGDGKDAGTNAFAWNYHGKSNQQWRVEGDKIISQANGMALDIKDGSKESNTEIILWPAKQGASTNQSWQFVMHFN